MKTNIVSIPKNIFEQTFFQRGGQKEVHKALTGEYAFGLEDEDKANAELESGEYLKDSQGIKQVEGEKHSQGGEKLALEDGTKILSDFLKLGGKGAKYINDKYDLGLKASDTYSTVLDKYNKKSGLDKINEELEEYIAKLDKQQKETKDENTLALNTEYLTSELNEEFEKKKPLEKIRETIFEDVFNLQESTKKQEEDKTNFQTGGTMTYNGDPVIEIGKKYGLSPERALELYKKGGELPMYQNAGTYTKEEQKKRLKDFYLQAKSLGYEGDFNLNGKDIGTETGKLQKFMAEKAPEAVVAYFKTSGQPMTAKGMDIVKKQYSDVFSKLGISPVKDSASYTTEEKKKITEALGDKLDNSFWLNQFQDNKWDWRFPMVSAVNPVTPVGDTGYQSIVAPTYPGATQPNVIATPQQPYEKTPETAVAKNRGMLLLPDQTPMTPSSQMAHLKPQRRFERIDPVFISPERQLAEIDRGVNSAQANLAMLPDAQAAAAFSSLNANNTESMNKVLLEVNRYNAQAKESANRTNAQIGQAEENAAWQDALNYERNTYLAKANTEQSWRNFYDTLALNQMNDWKHIEMLNQSNALNPEVQYTNEGYKVFKPEFSNNPELIRALNASNVNTENMPTKKAKAKKGGRFKKC